MTRKWKKCVLIPAMLAGLCMTASAEAFSKAAASPLLSMGVIGVALLIVFGVAMYKSV